MNSLGEQLSLETRKVLLGHRNGDITTQYSAPELHELLEASNKANAKPGSDFIEKESRSRLNT